MRQRWESVREKIYAQMRGEEHMGGVFKQCVSFLGRRRTARHLKALYVLLPSVEGVFVATETRLLREELTNNLSIALALASIRFSLIFDTFIYTLWARAPWYYERHHHEILKCIIWPPSISHIHVSGLPNDLNVDHPSHLARSQAYSEWIQRQLRPHRRPRRRVKRVRRHDNRDDIGWNWWWRWWRGYNVAGGTAVDGNDRVQEKLLGVKFGWVRF